MKLVVLILTLSTALLGCQPQWQSPSQKQIEPTSPYSFSQADWEQWITALGEISQYSQEQADVELKGFSKPITKAFPLYRYGLVNQQLGDRLGWIRARDAFRQLGKLVAGSQLQPLVNLLEEHNQKLINADARTARLLETISQSEQQQAELGSALEQSQQALAKLQQQLEALKAVETAISIKRESPEPVAE